jgi:pimeloyl-ACP methyl ester carboxylesterase
MISNVQPIRHAGILHYKEQVISYHYWVHAYANGTIDTVIFLGTGQTGKIPAWVATLAPTGVAVIEGMPHWKAHPSGNDLKDFSNAYTLNALNKLLHKFSLQDIHLIAVSQGVPGAVWAAAKIPEHVKNIGLVVPLGFTAHIFGDSDTARVRELKKRAIRSLLHVKRFPLFSIRNFYAFSVLLQARFAETERGASDRKYAEGLSHDITKTCRRIIEQQHARQTHLTIFLGETDPIFPPKEVKTALRKAKLEKARVRILPGLGHASFTAKHEKKALGSIVADVRS